MERSVCQANTPKGAKRYWRTLLALMSLKDGLMYPSDHVFSPSDLLTIRPSHVVEFFCLKVYGTPYPEADAKPSFGRSSSLESYKKQISYFMPNKLVAWNVATETGNPTRSIPVNELIKRVKKEEVRKRGKATVARRPLELDEFGKLIDMLRAEKDPLKTYGYICFVYSPVSFFSKDR